MDMGELDRQNTPMQPARGRNQTPGVLKRTPRYNMRSAQKPKVRFGGTTSVTLDEIDRDMAFGASNFVTQEDVEQASEPMFHGRLPQPGTPAMASLFRKKVKPKVVGTPANPSRMLRSSEMN
jgi:hypothetical protein